MFNYLYAYFIVDSPDVIKNYVFKQLTNALTFQLTK